jgi:hypothetical protein
VRVLEQRNGKFSPRCLRCALFLPGRRRNLPVDLMQMQFSWRSGPAGRLAQRSGRIRQRSIPHDLGPTMCRVRLLRSVVTEPYKGGYGSATVSGPARSRAVALADPNSGDGCHSPVLLPVRKWRATPQPHTPRACLSSCLAIRQGFSSQHSKDIFSGSTHRVCTIYQLINNY